MEKKISKIDQKPGLYLLGLIRQSFRFLPGFKDLQKNIRSELSGMCGLRTCGYLRLASSVLKQFTVTFNEGLSIVAFSQDSLRVNFCDSVSDCIAFTFRLRLFDKMFINELRLEEMLIVSRKCVLTKMDKFSSMSNYSGGTHLKIYQLLE